MFNFFDNGNASSAANQAPEWLPLLQEAQERLFAFLTKLEERMEELTDSAVPELLTVKADNEREFYALYSGVQGQLDSIRDKAQKVYEEKIEDLYYQINSAIGVLHPNHRELTSFRTTCSERYHNDFDGKYQHHFEKLKQTQFTDYEALYSQLMAEHERIKNKFTCHQCGDIIPLTKLYFIVSHLTCPSCQTKNTFKPSTLASRLEEIGRGLAEQRTQHLLEKYNQEQQRERDIYHQAHLLKLKISPVKNDSENDRYRKQVNELEQQRQESLALAPQYYQQYQRAMFDEWKRLVPDLAEQTENFYQGLQRRNF